MISKLRHKQNSPSRTKSKILAVILIGLISVVFVLNSKPELEGKYVSQNYEASGWNQPLKYTIHCQLAFEPSLRGALDLETRFELASREAYRWLTAIQEDSTYQQMLGKNTWELRRINAETRKVMQAALRQDFGCQVH